MEIVIDSPELRLAYKNADAVAKACRALGEKLPDELPEIRLLDALALEVSNALSAVNGFARAHTATRFCDVQFMLARAEAALWKHSGGALPTGALVSVQSETPTAKSYAKKARGKIAVSLLTFRRRHDGWSLVEIRKVYAFPGSNPGCLIRVPIRDAA